MCIQILNNVYLLDFPVCEPPFIQYLSNDDNKKVNDQTVILPYVKNIKLNGYKVNQELCVDFNY